MSTKKVIFFAVVALLVLASCKTIKYAKINADMSLIDLGMSKASVIERIGKPNMVVIAQATEEGKLEVFEYMRLDYNSYTETQERRPVWVYFVDGEVVEWGPGEDWQIDNAMTLRILEKYKQRKRP